MSRTYKNPILQGFYPDPSICRVDEDYYLITSTFEYFPGLPIFHSRDLVNWRQIGHVLDRPSQLDLDKIRPSGGLFAPTIRYHEGTFYVINTMIDGPEKSGNFIVTATDPAGPWSDPYWLDDAPGIDPSLLFDDDGRAWYCGNGDVGSPTFDGDKEIWLKELDLQTMQLTGPKYSLWRGALRDAIWAEAPHIYKINGQYYLMIAEGGTAHDHAITIARADDVTGPYVGNTRNPILTHRHLGLEQPIVGTGHGDLIETQNGEWWMVLLAMRPYGGYFYNLGRETFLAPVVWEDGWPIVAPDVGKVVQSGVAPNLPEHSWLPEPNCDHFESDELSYAWNFLRTPREQFWSLTERPNFLRLKCRPERLMKRVNPSFIGRRQQYINFTARMAMEFQPQAENECAGLVLLQNSAHNIRCTVTLNKTGETIVQLIRRKRRDTLLCETAVSAGRIYFMVDVTGQDYQFYVTNKLDNWQKLGDPVDGRVLSTPVADGFTGAYLGMYASSNGETSDNYADFDWFEITPK